MAKGVESLGFQSVEWIKMIGGAAVIESDQDDKSQLQGLLQVRAPLSYEGNPGGGRTR